jgi:hypothetical protein
MSTWEVEGLKAKGEGSGAGDSGRRPGVGAWRARGRGMRGHQAGVGMCGEGLGVKGDEKS